MQLTGQLAVVTGAAQGIGKGIALALAKRGVRVVCLDIQDPANEQTAAEASAFCKGCAAMHCNVADAEEVKAVFETIQNTMGTVDILVNNAAVFSTLSMADDSYEQALAHYRENMDCNALGTFLCAKMVAPGMKKQGYGQILNVVTNHVKRYLFPPSSNEHAYDASKYAQLAFNESLDCELKPCGVRVNAICPASTRSPMLQAFFDSIGMALTKENIGKCAGVASLLECDEVGQAACHILSWDADQPTGKAFLLMHSEDCEKLKNGYAEDLARW